MPDTNFPTYIKFPLRVHRSGYITDSSWNNIAQICCDLPKEDKDQLVRKISLPISKLTFETMQALANNPKSDKYKYNSDTGAIIDTNTNLVLFYIRINYILPVGTALCTLLEKL